MQHSKIDYLPTNKIYLFFLANLLPAYAFFQLSSLNVLSSDFLSFFPGHPEILSNMSSIYLLADAIFLIPVGFFLDQIDLKFIFLVFLSLLVLGVFFIALHYSIQLMYIGRFLIGAGQAFSFLAGFKVIKYAVPARYLSFSTTLLIAVAMFGGFLAQIPLLFLLKCVGWFRVFFINTALGVLLLIGGFFILNFCLDSNNIEKSQLNLFFMKKQINNLLPNILIGILIGLLSAPLIIIGSTWGNQYLTKVIGFSITDSGIINSVIFLVTILGMPFFGYLSDKYNKPFFFLCYNTYFAFFVSLLLIMFHKYNFYVQLCFFSVLAFNCSAQSLGYVLIHKINSTKIQNGAMAIANVVIMLTCSILPLLFNFFGHFGYFFGMHNFFLSGVLVIPAVLLIGIVIIISLRKRFAFLAG